ncbi:MAG: hypothetical protein IPH44_11595 [Myxococcales bacterium]|nr:hypothetical protein [Myxococcales bacterium]
MSVEGSRLDQERRLLAHVDAWRAHGSGKRLGIAARMLLLRQTAFSANTLGTMQQVLERLYTRAEGHRLPGLGGRISPREAQEQLQSLLVPNPRGGRPRGGAPLVADAVTILLDRRRGRSATACLRDKDTRAEVLAELLRDKYPRGRCLELLEDASGKLRRALDRAIRRR